MDRRASAEICKLIEEEIARLGGRLDEVLTCSDELILFGSRACGVGASGSDWDLLVIGRNLRSGRRRFGENNQLDFVVVDRNDEPWERFLGSELAYHVSTFGVWIEGTEDWINCLKPRSEVISLKTRRLRQRSMALIACWADLAVEYRSKWLNEIRRDAQRLQLHLDSMPIPATFFLDIEWRTSPEIVLGKIASSSKSLQLSCLDSLIDMLRNGIELLPKQTVN